MKIIIDAMGGDHAPEQIVAGALQAAKEFGVELILVGRGEELLSCMKAQGWDTLPAGVEVANAAAGTELADAYSARTLIGGTNPPYCSARKAVHDP